MAGEDRPCLVEIARFALDERDDGFEHGQTGVVVGHLPEEVEQLRQPALLAADVEQDRAVRGERLGFLSARRSRVPRRPRLRLPRGRRRAGSSRLCAVASGHASCGSGTRFDDAVPSPRGNGRPSRDRHSRTRVWRRLSKRERRAIGSSSAIATVDGELAIRDSLSAVSCSR